MGFSQASEEAQNSLSDLTRTRLKLLSKIRDRFGHTCGDIEEYLHAAEDDLVEWEESLGSGKQCSARMQLNNQWEHFFLMIEELGRLEGKASITGEWRERAQARRRSAQSMSSVAC